MSCNPTHVFHAHCIRDWNHCPVCLMKIDKGEVNMDTQSDEYNSVFDVRDYNNMQAENEEMAAEADKEK